MKHAAQAGVRIPQVHVQLLGPGCRERRRGRGTAPGVKPLVRDHEDTLEPRGNAGSSALGHPKGHCTHRTLWLMCHSSEMKRKGQLLGDSQEVVIEAGLPPTPCSIFAAHPPTGMLRVETGALPAPTCVPLCPGGNQPHSAHLAGATGRNTGPSLCHCHFELWSILRHGTLRDARGRGWDLRCASEARQGLRWELWLSLQLASTWSHSPCLLCSTR